MEIGAISVSPPLCGGSLLQFGNAAAIAGHDGDHHQLRCMVAGGYPRLRGQWDRPAGDPYRLELATRRMADRSVVLFSIQQQKQLFDALQKAAEEFHYRLTDASIESWHLHWIVEHGFDPVATMV